MSAADAWFLYFEKPNAPLHIGSLGIFEGKIPVEKTKLGLAERLHLIPRYRQRAVFPPLFTGHPRWEDDPQFSVDRHIRAVQLPAPGNEQQLYELTSEIFAKILPRDRPLWDIVVIHGLEGDKTAYVNRVHHCLVDGVSGVELLLALLDLSPSPPPTPPPAKAWEPEPWSPAVISWAEAMLDQWSRGVTTLADAQLNLLDPGRALRGARDFARGLMGALPAAMRLPSPTIWNRPLSAQRRAAFISFSFQEIRAIRGELGGTVNDVCLTILGGALGRYLESRGVRTEGLKLRLMTPVNVRAESESGDLGNRVSMMLPQLPVGIHEPLERLAAVRAEMDRMKSAQQGRAFDQFIRLADNAPAAFHALAGVGGIPGGMINLVCTNVPGPLIPLYGSGHRMLASWPLLPLAGDLGLGVAIISYDKSLYFGVMSDPSIVPDVELVRDFIDEEFQRLRSAAGVAATDLPDEIGVQSERPRTARRKKAAARSGVEQLVASESTG
jgi:WS/DGAT/MGAT family acyltransferase